MLRQGVLIGALLAGGPACAALSGFHDSGEKIMAILQSAEVAEELRQAPIGAVMNTGTTAQGHDEWLVRVQDCDLLVEVIAEPPPGPGKTIYRVEILHPCE